MKFKKSILSAILIFSMVINSMFSTLVFANTLDYKTSITRMNALGIMDSSIEDANKELTKEELIKSMAIALGLKDTADSLKGTTIFSDVTAGSDLSGYINAVMGQGLLYGTEGDYYYPEQGVTYQDACIIMVRLLGYTKSDLTGSYPINYMKKAADLKLTYQLNLKKDDIVPIWAEAVLFDRVFDSLIKGSTTEYFSNKYFINQYSDTDITGKLVETTIVGNSKTSDNLGDDEVYMTGLGITDKVKYTIKSDAGYLELGGKYKLYVDGTTITKVCLKENFIKNYAVTSVAGSTINYSDDNNVANNMILPETPVYYYHGVPVDYSVAMKAVKGYSSIILMKNSDDSDWDYGIIIDPNFGEPQIYKADNTKLIDQLKNTKYAYLYRHQTNGQDSNIQVEALNAHDVVYFVSDILNKNTFVYVEDKVVIGTITAFVPDVLNPTGVTINKVNYSFSKYFNKSKLNNYDGSVGNFLTNIKVDDFKTLVLGYDGTIVDIY